MDDSDLPFYTEGRRWQRQSHIYVNPFYYIDYCLAQTVSLEFWAMIQRTRTTPGSTIWPTPGRAAAARSPSCCKTPGWRAPSTELPAGRMRRGGAVAGQL